MSEVPLSSRISRSQSGGALRKTCRVRSTADAQARVVGTEFQWLQRHPEAGSSWPIWPKAAHGGCKGGGCLRGGRARRWGLPRI